MSPKERASGLRAAWGPTGHLPSPSGSLNREHFEGPPNNTTLSPSGPSCGGVGGGGQRTQLPAASIHPPPCPPMGLAASFRGLAQLSLTQSSVQHPQPGREPGRLVPCVCGGKALSMGVGQEVRPLILGRGPSSPSHHHRPVLRTS